MFITAVLIACSGSTPEPVEPYSETFFDDTRIGSDSTQENFQNITGTLDFHDGPFESVTMVVDLRSTCFPWEQWDDDPPPIGHNWPPSCDAFDRNFEITLDDPVAETDPPAFEVMRAITPFGGPLHLEIDLTDMANARPGTHSVRTHITTSSDAAGVVSGSAGGWNVTARIDAIPGPPPRSVLAAIPLFNGRYTSDDEVIEVPFTSPPGTDGVSLEHRVTGHGGATGDINCIGPAEEFCRRRHHVYANGEEFDDWIAWREDCEELCTLESGGPFGGNDYCAENPCGAEQSVRAPRANWCPGALTPPDEFDRNAWREAGDHSFGFSVDNVEPGGTWRVSSMIYIYGTAPEE